MSEYCRLKPMSDGSMVPSDDGAYIHIDDLLKFEALVDAQFKELGRVANDLIEYHEARKKQKERAAKAREARAIRDKRILDARKRKVTIEDIAEQEGITHQRVSQIIQKNKKLKEKAA